MNRRVAAHGGHQRAFDLGAGAVAVGVQNTAPAVGRFASKRELAVFGPVKVGARFDESADLFRTFFGQKRHTLRYRKAVPCHQRVGRMKLRRIVLPHRTRYPALRDRRRSSFAKTRFRHHGHPAIGQSKRRRKARYTSAYDDDIRFYFMHLRTSPLIWKKIPPRVVRPSTFSAGFFVRFLFGFAVPASKHRKR